MAFKIKQYFCFPMDIVKIKYIRKDQQGGAIFTDGIPPRPQTVSNYDHMPSSPNEKQEDK
jgi:hypothetical protein